MQPSHHDKKFDAGIPNNGYRLADKLVDGIWVRTCCDFLKTGEIFRMVDQAGMPKTDKVFKVVVPMKLATITDPISEEKVKRYHGGEMRVEEVHIDI
jgi:hypothetical protein